MKILVNDAELTEDAINNLGRKKLKKRNASSKKSKSNHNSESNQEHSLSSQKTPAEVEDEHNPDVTVPVEHSEALKPKKKKGKKKILKKKNG